MFVLFFQLAEPIAETYWFHILALNVVYTNKCVKNTICLLFISAVAIIVLKHKGHGIVVYSV